MHEGPLMSVQQIYNSEISKLKDASIDLETNISRFHTVKHSFYNQRHFDLPPTIASRR